MVAKEFLLKGNIMFTARMRIALSVAVILTSSAVVVQGFADTSCTKLEFDCDQGKTCLPKRWLCDGDPDCRDGTDEMVENCKDKPHRNCTDSEFKCGNDKCLPKSWQCDGSDDCGDNSDEVGCSTGCSENEHQCDNNLCITLSWKCDGMADCSDGSDEAGCITTTPTTLSSNISYFYCNHGHRLPMSYRCDGDRDCQDGSDEQNCTSVPSPEKKCLDTEYQCDNSYCILTSWVCDGTADCQGAEDERNCDKTPCTDRQFRCKSGECIPRHEKCNGFADCRDRTDENDCEIEAAVDADVGACNTTTHFQCDSGNLCIPRTKLCDKITDCSNNQDESEALCGVNECEQNNGGCDHQCINTEESYHCACNKGYRLIGRYSCEDVDECKETPGSCSQVCTNTQGSFHCSCLKGYLRDPANYTRCKAAVGETYLIFSHSYDIRSLRLRDKDMTSVVSDTHGATALDFHYNRNKILWSDRKEKKIFRADMADAQNREVIVAEEDVSADGLAVDWIHSLIYYTDTRNMAVKLVSWDHKYLKTIVTEKIGHPRSIAVSPSTGYVYWSDWGEEPKIERSGLDGSFRKAIITQPHVSWPNGITIDHSTDRLYWCDGRLNKISTSRLDGSHVEVILFSPSILRLPYSISVFEDRLYWTDWSHLALYSANKFNGEDVHNVTAGHMLESPKVVHVLHQYRQPEGDNVCEYSNCGHLCVRSVHGAPLCTCADGHYLATDNITCTPGDDPTVIEVATPSVAPSRPSVVRSPEHRASSRPETPPYVAESTDQKLEQIKDEVADATTHLGLVLGVVLGVLAGLCVGLVVFVAYRRVRSPVIKRFRFHNPVYRKTTDDESDGRGFTINQEQLFYNPTREYGPPDPTLTMTEADDAPLTPEDNAGV